MDDLNDHLDKLLIRTPPLQAHHPLQVRESQGPQDFHRFPELPLEIREMIWIFSLPGARSIQVRPIVPKDGMPFEFSYKDSNPIAVLQTSRESRKTALLALSVYGGFIDHGIYFYPGRYTLLFVGLEAVFPMLLSTGERPQSIVRLLPNTFDHEASRLKSRCAGSSTTIEWSAPFLENFTIYTKRGGQSCRALRLRPVHRSS